MPERVQSAGGNASVHDPANDVCLAPRAESMAPRAESMVPGVTGELTPRPQAVAQLVQSYDGRAATAGPSCHKEGVDVVKASVALAGGAAALAMGAPTVAGTVPGVVAFISGAVGFAAAVAEYANCTDARTEPP
jgi:hypothetical protein